MKNLNKLLLTLIAAVLPIIAWADETELKVFNSTFTGATYGIAGETYSTGTLTTAEGYDWVWNGEGENKSPVLRMTEVGGEECLSAKLKTSNLSLNTEFRVPGKIQEITMTLGGNIGTVEFFFGDYSSTYTWTYSDNNLHTVGFDYKQTTLKSTLENQTVRVLLTPKDASSGEPIYLKSFSISTEVVVSYGKNVIESVFTDFDEEHIGLLAEDDAYNWLMALPYRGVTLDSAAPVTWNDELCLHMHLTSTYSNYSPELTFTSAFPVLGKVKKIVVKAGGDLRLLYYTKEDEGLVLSESFSQNVPYYEDMILDFGEGIEMHDVISFKLTLDRTGITNLFLKSVTIVMEDGEEVEIDGILSTFYDWDEWEKTDSYKSGSLKSKEGTPWQAKLYDPTTEVYATMLQEDGDESTLEQCMVFVNNNSGDINFELTNQFEVAGPVKKIVIRYANPLSSIEAVVYENGTGEGVQICRLTPVPGSGLFSDAELLFDGTTEYSSANIKLTFEASSLLFLQSITIIQKDDSGGSGGEEQGGKCGDNLDYAITKLPYTVWVWDDDAQQSVETPAYKLTITGTGDMYDYTYDNYTYLSDAPWIKDYQECITEIELPEGLTKVGDEAFDGCYNARVLSLPSTLQSIGIYAFCNVQGWPSEDLQLPENLVSIDSRAFAYCGGIRNLYLPASLTSIGTAAFCGLYYIENFYVDDANPVYKADGNAIIEKASKTLIAGNSNTVIPDYVEIIGNTALYGIRVDEMVIPNSVHTIRMYAFNYSYIKTVNIPSSVKTIEAYAFQGCSKLTSVTIGSGVTSIGALPFYSCTNILDVYCYANPDALTWSSTGSESRSFMADKMTQMHVRAADLEKWQEKFGFLNVTFVGDLGGDVTPITEETRVAVASLENENLSDNTVDGIYYNLDPNTGNGYNGGYLVIGQTTDMSLISDATPGSDDVRTGFTGIILKVAPGKGVIVVSARSIGKVQLAVRIGDGTPTYAAHNERGDTYISYNVTEETYVYVYAVGQGALVKAFAREAAEPEEDALLIYGISVYPGIDADGIEDVQMVDGKSVNGEWFDLSGKKLQGLPEKNGIYIRNGRKVVIK